MTLLQVADALYSTAMVRHESLKVEEVEYALKCLYAGLELVLPTSIELKFRLLLAHLLKRVGQVIRSREQVQKCHQLIQAVIIMVYYLSISIGILFREVK